MAPLSEKQRQFAHEYVIDLNGTQAAIRAGYSKRGANVTGVRLLSNHRVQELVAKLMAEKRERTKIDADWLLTRLATMADVRIGDLYDPTTGRFLEPWEMGDGAQLLVTSVKSRDEMLGGTKVAELTEVRLESRTKVLEMIGRHVKVSAFEENVNLHEGSDRAERIRRAQKRAGIRGKE